MVDQIYDAQAQPSKNFFVNMLVRDIELTDALLDLLDNCVDGILRNTDPDFEKSDPYSGYWANFVIGPDFFSLEDNCGGIPIELAKNKAFAIGKPDRITGHDGRATVGMYGIGMKRAIFKLGKNASVRSWSDIPLEVKISPDWLDSDEWSPLPLKTLSEQQFQQRGTTIAVDHLHQSVKNEFSRSDFASVFSRRISSIYSLIISKGFSVTIRRSASEPLPQPISAKRFLLLSSDAKLSEKETIAPIIYRGQVAGVDVEIYAGMYRKLPTLDEQEADEQAKNRSDESGWTVACNDRVVIDRDKTWITGWGESSVPSFHNQFIAITGLVLLSSEDPHNLPLTTTKRGVDHGTEIYSLVKDMMREATKKLTQFTYKWKKSEADLSELYKTETVPFPLERLRAQSKALPMRTWQKDSSVRLYVPKLPTPKNDMPSARVSFVADKADVRKLALVYFKDEKASPKEVGQRAFLEELAHYAEAAE